jgi:ferredoxin
LKSVYETCGLLDAFKEVNVAFNYNTESVTIKNPHGKKLKEFTITKYIRDVDYLINVPKLKTHVAMMYTGAIKNWFGTIAGERKFDYHVVVSDIDDFAHMLIDIYMLNKPNLNILDAVVGMEHNGPAAGNPKAINLVLAGEDGFALDLTALYILGIDPLIVPTMRASFERKLIANTMDEIEVVGEPIHETAVSGFVLPDTAFNATSPIKESSLFLKLIEAIKPKVGFDYTVCTRCKECSKICPAQAIEFRSGKPRIRKGKCIKCFCCHELCTANAVKIKRSLLLKFLLTLGLYNKSVQLSVEKMFGMIAKARRRK